MHIFVPEISVLERSTLLFCILILSPYPETSSLTLFGQAKERGKTGENMHNTQQKKVN